MGSSNFKELSTPPCGTRLLILCLRTVVPEAVNIYKNGKILLRPSRITVVTMWYIPIRQDHSFKKCIWGTSLVVQWLRIRLPIQGTRVRALVQEDPTCGGATKSVCHSYWACALEPESHDYWARVLQLPKPARLEPVLRNKRSPRNEKPAHRNEDPMQPINK